MLKFHDLILLIPVFSINQLILFFRFWDDQCGELNKDRKNFKQDHADYENAIKFREDQDEDVFEKYAEDLIFKEQSMLRDTYPMRKAKVQMNLGKGAVIQALDNFDNKIYTQMRDIHYKPVDSRNRLSINWNPDDRTIEDKTI